MGVFNEYGVISVRGTPKLFRPITRIRMFIGHMYLPQQGRYLVEIPWRSNPRKREYVPRKAHIALTF